MSIVFALDMNELTMGIQDDVPLCMFFADNIVLLGESSEQIKIKPKLWRDFIV